MMSRSDPTLGVNITNDANADIDTDENAEPRTPLTLVKKREQRMYPSLCLLHLPLQGLGYE